MALQISKPTTYGVDASYWRIGVMNIHPRASNVCVVMDGYLNQAARQSGAQPLSFVELTLPYTTDVVDGGRDGSYEAVKLTPEFTGATDV